MINNKNYFDDYKLSDYASLYKTLEEILRKLKKTLVEEKEYVRRLSDVKKNAEKINLRTSYLRYAPHNRPSNYSSFLRSCNGLGIGKFIDDYLETGSWNSFDDYVSTSSEKVAALEEKVRLYEFYFKKFGPQSIVKPVEDIAELYNFLKKYSSFIDEWQLSRMLGMVIVFNSQYANSNPDHHIKNIEIINELASGYNPDGSLKISGYPCEQFCDTWGIFCSGASDFSDNRFVYLLTRLLYSPDQIDDYAYKDAYMYAVSSWQNTIEDAYVSNGAPLHGDKFNCYGQIDQNFFEHILALIKADYRACFSVINPEIITIKKILTCYSRSFTATSPLIVQEVLDLGIEASAIKLQQEVDLLPEDLRETCLSVIRGDHVKALELLNILDNSCFELKSMQYNNYAYTSCFGTSGFVKPIRDFREFFIYLACNPMLDEGDIARMLGLAIKFNAKYAKEHPEFSIDNIEIINELAKFLTDKGSFDVMAGVRSSVDGDVDIVEFLLAEIFDNKSSVDNRLSEFRTLLSSLLGDVFDEVPERNYVTPSIGRRLHLDDLVRVFGQIYDFDSYYTYGVAVNSKDKGKKQGSGKGKFEYKKGPKDTFSEYFFPSTCKLRSLPIKSCYDLMNEPAMIALPPSDFQRCMTSVKTTLLSEGYDGGLAYYLDFKSRELYRVALGLEKSFKSIDGNNNSKTSGKFDWRAYADFDKNAVVSGIDVAVSDVDDNYLSSFDFTSSQINTTLDERKRIGSCMDELKECYDACKSAEDDMELFVMAIDSAVEWLGEIEIFLRKKGISFNETKAKIKVLSN